MVTLGLFHISCDDQYEFSRLSSCLIIIALCLLSLGVVVDPLLHLASEPLSVVSEVISCLDVERIFKVSQV